MKIIILHLITSAVAVATLTAFQGCTSAGFGAHAALVVPAPSGSPETIPAAPPSRGVRVTYFGTNSYVLQSRDGTVLVDPYFSRVGPLWALALGKPFSPHAARIEEGFRYLPPRADLILVTHAHFDHLGDVPKVATRTGAVVALSPTGRNLAIAAGANRKQLTPMLAGERRSFGKISVTALDADHTRVLGREVYPGTLSRPPAEPRRISDWVVGEPLAWLVEMGGKRIYIESGGVRKLPPTGIGPVDLAIIGVPTKESLPRFPRAVRLLQPRFLLPSHQDDFGKPLDRGFHFSIPSDMKAVRRAHAQGALPGQLILLDYYRPWLLL